MVQIMRALLASGAQALDDDALMKLADLSDEAATRARALSDVCAGINALVDQDQRPGAGRTGLFQGGASLSALLTLVAGECDTIAAMAEAGTRARDALDERNGGDHGA